MSLTLSVVIPVFNAEKDLALCLQALAASSAGFHELIVVDDGSTDNSSEVARSFGAKLFHTKGRRGPAVARNLGAHLAEADLLFFLDADVCVHKDTLARILAAFESDPDLDALIGSYDDAPASKGFFAQYKNLQHAYVHQNAQERASTFWTGCGAIRRELFLAHGGFDENYRRPCIEDIELGCRLAEAGRKIRLDRSVQVKHLKAWSFRSMMLSDVFDRGIPWTRLILSRGSMPNDLNLKMAQRASVALVGQSLLGVGIAALGGNALWLGVSAASLLWAGFLNRDFYRFLAQRRGARFAMSAIPVHFFYFLYSGFAFGLGCMAHWLLPRRSRRG
ncbi:MAG: glycosyltransferase family 2 protein [Bryobacteraceae bacterium]